MPPIVLVGPENVLAVCLYGRRKSFQPSLPKARFLVIAAPRPSGSPDLDFIQAGLTGGRFFLPFEPHGRKCCLVCRERIADPLCSSGPVLLSAQGLKLYLYRQGCGAAEIVPLSQNGESGLRARNSNCKVRSLTLKVIQETARQDPLQEFCVDGDGTDGDWGGALC